MKLTILDAQKTKTGDVSLPAQFGEAYRPDLIVRAVKALQANARQRYGADPEAGKRSSAELSRRRRKYRGSYGAGISRVPRKILSRRGTRMHWVGAFAPGTVGGRRAHAPKAEKIWDQKVNTRENRKAIRSALAATINPELVTARGHKIPADYPFILDNSFIALDKTKSVEAALVKLGFAAELDRSLATTVRAGKAKLRGRKTRRPKGLLLVVAETDAPIFNATANVPGVDIVAVAGLNAQILAPGTHAGRATLFTQGAIDALTAGLFLDAGKKKQASVAPEKSEASKKTVKKAIKKTAAPKAAKAAPKAAKKAPEAAPEAAPVGEAA